MTPELDWVDGGPRSVVYDDVYFSRTDGLAESRTVFLQGCGLPGAWVGRDRFTVAELGFGTGLNIVALLDLWRRSRASSAHLSIFSVERHLLSRDDAAHALEAWRGDGADVIDALLARWPDARQGFHRIDLPDFDATLDLYVGEVEAALERWSGPADAWFLDGFAPAKNPAMWSDEVLAAVGRLSAPGARAATFTVAGHVRQGLAQAGFTVEKRPGFGRKRERLEAQRVSASPAIRSRSVRRVAVVGGGVAGAALVRAFHSQGVVCTLVEAVQPGAGASGNPAALVTPRFDAGFGAPAELHAQAFARAVDLYRRETPQAVISEGALQLGDSPRDTARFARLAAWEGFAPGGLQTLCSQDALTRLDEAHASTRFHEATASTGDALLIEPALVVEPAAILQAWLAFASRVAGQVTELRRSQDRWLCCDAAGETLAEADAVCLAAGFDTAMLVPEAGLRPVRGQAEFTTALSFTGQAAAWGPYAIPLREGLLFGASHVRGDLARDVRADETATSLTALETRRPALAERLRALPAGALQSRAAVRATTPDHLPLAGETTRTGVYVLGGLGGRGFTLAPLLAEHIAALALGRPLPLSTDLAHRMRVGRFKAENPHTS